MRSDDSSFQPRSDQLPDPNATGAPDGLPSTPAGAPGRETREREAARRRGEAGSSGDIRRIDSHRGAYTGVAAPDVARRAFAALAENVRDYAIFLMDADGIITFWGEGARLIKWWTKAQAEGGHLRMLYPDGGSEDGTAEAHLQSAAESGEYTGEGQRVRSDGSTFWAGVTLTALRDDQGVLLGFAKVTRDLTARRAADAALIAARDDAERARALAEQASRAKSSFLATMSHEIRTPINAIMGYVDLLNLEISGPLTEEQRHQLERIRASNAHLLGIIDEILDLSRLDADRVTVDRRAGRLGPPIKTALDLVYTQARSKEVALSNAVSDFAADVPYCGDEDRVRQILVALLSNAVKFTPSGGQVTVSAGATEQPPPGAQLEGSGPWVYVRVEDNGPGIPRERMAAVFEPFEQADMSLTRQHGGSGLGLTIARRLAHLMGGDLTVRSQAGTGSTFFLWLPTATAEVVDSKLSQSEQMEAPGPRLLREVRDVILLELEPVLRGFVARLRSDPATPSARTLSDAELEDHLATFLSDVAETLSTLDLGGGPDAAAPRDGTAIQQMVAQRHGSQRFRSGWSEPEIQREFQILREEISAAIQRHASGERLAEMKGALDLVAVLIAAAEQISLETYRAGLDYEEGSEYPLPDGGRSHVRE